MIKVVTDSSCDLPKPETDSLGVTVVPLSVSFGQEVFLDGELSHGQYWEKTKGPFWPKSSQPSVGAFEAVFAPLVDEGHRALCLTITSHHSGTYNSASVAAQTIGERVAVVDSLSVSAGLAWQVIAAVEAAEQGSEMEEIISITRAMSSRTQLFALLDTLENVRKGGRVSAVIPMLGRLMRVLDVKPMLTMVDGELKLLAAARSYRKGLDRIREEVTSLAPLDNMAVLHTRVPEIATAFADELAEAAGFPREEIRVLETGPALSTHAGPRVIGAFVLSETVCNREKGKGS